MTFKILNRVRMSLLSAPGTGVLPLNTAIPGFQTLVSAGAVDGDTTPYLVEDGSPLGIDWEIGLGTFHTNGTLTRTSITQTSAGNQTALNLTANAIVSAVTRAEDIDPAQSLESLTDVTVTSPAVGDLLTWSGAAWVNQPSAPLIKTPTIVQAAAAVTTAANTVVTVTLPNPPTAGNLLVALCCFGNGNLLGTPVGPTWDPAWVFSVVDDDANSTALQSSLAFRVVRLGDSASQATITTAPLATKGMVGIWELNSADLTRFGAHMRNAQEQTVSSNPTTISQAVLSAIGALVLYIYGGPTGTTSRTGNLSTLDATASASGVKAEISHDVAADNIYTAGTTVTTGTGQVTLQMMSLVGYQE